MNRLKTTLLLSLLTVLMVLMGSALGGTSGMVMAFFMAAAMNFFSYWFSDKIVLKMYGAREVGENDHPAFYGMVRRLALQAGLPCRSHDSDAGGPTGIRPPVHRQPAYRGRS